MITRRYYRLLRYFRSFCNTTKLASPTGICPIPSTSRAGSTACISCLSALSVPLSYIDPLYQIVQRSSSFRFEVGTVYSVTNECFNNTPLVNLTFRWVQIISATNLTSLQFGNLTLNSNDIASDILQIKMSTRYDLYIPSMTLITNRTYGMILPDDLEIFCI